MRFLKHQLVPVRRKRSFEDFLKFRQNLLLFLSLLLLNLLNFLSHLLQFPLLLLYQLLESRLILHLHLRCERIYRLYPLFLLFHDVQHLQNVKNPVFLIELIPQLSQLSLFILMMHKTLQGFFKKIPLFELKLLKSLYCLFFQLAFFVKFSEHAVDIVAHAAGGRGFRRRGDLRRH